MDAALGGLQPAAVTARPDRQRLRQDRQRRLRLRVGADVEAARPADPRDLLLGHPGLEQAGDFCNAQAVRATRERTPVRGANRMTGIQPGIGGALTGADKGACEDVTGTPYVGADQQAAACGTARDADFPQPLNQAAWQQFSVQSPARAAQVERETTGQVTGSTYEQGFIRFGNYWKVYVQASPEFRRLPEDLLKLYVKNDRDEMVPYSAFMTMRKTEGPNEITRYNIYNSAAIRGEPA